MISSFDSATAEFPDSCKLAAFVFVATKNSPDLIALSAGDRGHDAEYVSLAQLRLIPFQIADIFVIDINVYETS
jgi:hypothetical protein